VTYWLTFNTNKLQLDSGIPEGASFRASWRLSFSLRLIRPLAEARPGIKENKRVLDTRFRAYDG
jgi:hypothetical protein